jgi:hypothetical protein
MAHVRNGRHALKARQEAAQARAGERAKRSDAEQLLLLASRPGLSKREHARLHRGKR